MNSMNLLILATYSILLYIIFSHKLLKIFENKSINKYQKVMEQINNNIYDPYQYLSIKNFIYSSHFIEDIFILRDINAFILFTGSNYEHNRNKNNNNDDCPINEEKLISHILKNKQIVLDDSIFMIINSQNKLKIKYGYKTNQLLTKFDIDYIINKVNSHLLLKKTNEAINDMIEFFNYKLMGVTKHSYFYTMCSIMFLLGLLVITFAITHIRGREKSKIEHNDYHLDNYYNEYKDNIYKDYKEENCSICFDILKICRNKPVIILNCKHIFHRLCMNSWIKMKNSCPLCRVLVNIN
jgi:hypothetical protein